MGARSGAARRAGRVGPAASRYRFFRDANLRERVDDPLDVPFAALELGLDGRAPTGRTCSTSCTARPASSAAPRSTSLLLEALAGEFDSSILYPVESGFVLRTAGAGPGRLAEHEYSCPVRPAGSASVDDVAPRR